MLHYNCFKDGKWESDEKSFSGAQAVDLTGRYCVAVTCLLVLEVLLWVHKYQILEIKPRGLGSRIRDVEAF